MTGEVRVRRPVVGGGRSGGWDAVVVGARVAGASTALLLARAGLRVLVVDRARRGSDTLSTHALMRGGVLQLRRWGVLDRVVATGAPPVRQVTFHYGPESMAVSLKPYAGVDALYAPRRTVLDAILVDAAEEAGARFRFGVAVTDLARNGARPGRRCGPARPWRGHLDRARAARCRCRRTRLSGGRSGGGTDRRGGRPRRGIRLRVLARRGPGRLSLVLRRRAAVAGAIRGDDGLACVFAGGPPGVLAAALRHRRPAEAQQALLARLDHGLAKLVAAPAGRPGAGLPRCRRGCAVRTGAAGRWWGTPAGGQPLSTHGITAALHDAELLATAVVAGAASERATRIALAGSRASGTDLPYRCAPSSTASPPTNGTPPKPASYCTGSPR